MNLTERIIVSKELDDLGQALKVKFGLAPTHPTKEEVVKIVDRMKKIPPKERTDDQWRSVIIEVIKPEGIYKYEGYDFSSANNLLNQIEELLKD